MTTSFDAAAGTGETDEQRIHAILAQLYPPDDAMAFLQTPQTWLGGEIPARVIARGDGRRVLDVLQAIVDGAYL